MGFLTDTSFSFRILILVFFGLFGTCFSKSFKAIFVFGDSLVDVGNNNYILTRATSNYYPNGIDFGKPTGRFTNGRTIVDVLGQELGFKMFIPPYLAPSTTGSVILQGVNLASGGAGILNETGRPFGGRINMDAQIDNFANTRQDIINMIGLPAALDLVKNSLFSIIIGNNDVTSNFMTPSDSFLGSVIPKFRLQLTRLYDLGARKVMVSNVGPVGCLPHAREANPNSGGKCAISNNQKAQIYNNQLRSLITELRNSLQGSNFIYADVYRIVQDIIQNYTSYGFENADSSCCHTAGRFGALTPCVPISKVCEDRSKYIFWDPYHSSDAANSVIARRLLDGDDSDIWPINIRQLELVDS